jgi:uncharacterized phage protein gp47/JayE
MPFARSTLAQLIDRVRGDLRGRLESTGALLRRAMIDVLGAVWAGGLHELYGYLQWLALQLFATTAEREALLMLAAEYGITPVPAQFATGNVTATGVNGSSILAGAIISLDAATSYRVVTGAVIAGGVATLPVVAVLAGATANVPAGTSLTFQSPTAGVNPGATVAAPGITGGIAEEGTEEVRDRLLLRKRKPPKGGSDQDYISWALAVPGVTRAWVFPHELGLGTVVVRFVMDDPARPSIFPSPGEVAAVQAAELAQRPITAAVTTVAPTNLAVAFTLHIVPDNADTRAAVTAELRDLLSRDAQPGDGAGLGTILLSAIRTAVGVASGVTDYVVTVPPANVVPGVGQLPTVGVITWV